MENPTQQSPVLVARVIAGAMALGVVTLWVISWVITEGGARGIGTAAFSPQLGFAIWAVFALSGFGAALFFRGRALQAAEGGGHASAVQSSLIIAWALLEGPALLSGVLFFLNGSRQVLMAAIPVYFVGLLITFPRAEWFGQ